MKFLVLFLFLSALNGGNDNFPQIRGKTARSGAPLVVHRFEDMDNVCYVAESVVYAESPQLSAGTSISISCVKAAK